MEDQIIEEKTENNPTNQVKVVKENNQKQIAGAILIVGIMIAGAILLKDSTPPAKVINNGNQEFAASDIKPVSADERAIGNPNAKVTLVMYEDFQCPWCGKFENESEQMIRKNYSDTVKVVYRDFPFLGPESYRSAEASMCADDQGKFWQYHDYLFTHQNGENRGAFSDANLKSFAKNLGLDEVAFDKCFEAGKYTKAVLDSKAEGASIGVRGTPKGFILKNGKVVDSIDGYLQIQAVTAKIDAALK